MVKQKPAIIIPVYNHGRQLGEVIRQAMHLDLPVFVIDDGSTDCTAETLRKIDGITVLHHHVNQGKGAALLTGFTAAVEQKCNWAVTLDGDGQHNPAETRNLLKAVNDAERCIVIGKREGMEGRNNVPWTSRFGRSFSNFWVWAAGGPRVADSQSGFRLYPIPEVLQLGTVARRYQFEVEILVRARQQGLSIKETPVSVLYQSRGERVSHFRPWRDFMRNSTTFSRLIFARVRRMLRL